MDDQTPARSAKRVWAERAAFAAVIAAIVVWAAVTRLPSAPCTILVDGVPIVSLESRSAAKAVLADVRFQKAKDAPLGSVRFAQRVTLRRARGESEVADLPEAAAALEKAVTVEVEAFAIIADDAPAAALSSRELAEETLRLVKAHYERKIAAPDTQSSFKEQVFIAKRHVDAARYCSSAEEALRILTSVAEEPVYHTLIRGDRAVRLAEHYGLSLSELKRLNPQTNLDRLVEGDRLLIRRAKTPITVISKATITKTITIRPPREAGDDGNARVGKRRMQLLVTYENGEPVSEEIVSQVTTWEKARRASGFGAGETFNAQLSTLNSQQKSWRLLFLIADS